MSVRRRTIRKVFVDTNVILDFFLEREGFYQDALKLWVSCESGLVEGYISAITVNNVYYVAKKLKSATTAMIVVRGLLRVFKVVPVDADLLGLAADLGGSDFEDDIQIQSAIRAGCRSLYTRDLSHYRTSAVQVLLPSAFSSEEVFL